MFAWRTDDGPLLRAVTDRSGGVSAPPFDALNLGDHVGDDPRAVVANRAAVADAAGLPAGRLLFMRQVHGATVARVAGADLDRPPPQADALVTLEADLGLAVMVADCLPVILTAGPVLAVAHVGRPGLAADLLPATVAAMRDLGAGEIEAILGPSVCGRCYEVPERMRAEVASGIPAAWAETSWGTPALDIAAGARAQLHAAGVGVEQLPGCTREDDTFFSYRRDGETGRFAAIVARRAA